MSATKPVKSVKTSKGKAAAKAQAEADSAKKKKLILIISIAAAALIVFITILSVCLSCSAKNKKAARVPFVNQYGVKTKVGYYDEVLGEYARTVKPEVSDGGLVVNGTIPRYPKYGSTVALDDAQRVAVINESWSLCSTTTRIGTDGFPKNTYDSMDKDGNLYLNGAPTGRKLYKHTASVGLYLGDVADDEKAVIKRVTLSPRGYTSYNVTGVYAPAGEVVKIEMSEADMEATGGIVVYIGQALYNSKANNIWAQRSINRMPVILNTLHLTKATTEFDERTGNYVGYVGSFVGGPVYIANENVKFTVTISGAVRYAHFILGYTTPEQYAIDSASSTPYFDLEVREYGVLHSGPKHYAKDFDYDRLYKAANMWEKISLVSTRISRQGIVFLYDPFVAAGAAVAFPGQMSVNCPMDWMNGSLDYAGFVKWGSWGNMHEYNHNFQGWGLPDGGEVTNNAVTLAEYSLFTRISSSRTIGSGGDGMSGWNRYTSAAFAARQVCFGRENDLAIYAGLLHTFGPDNYMDAATTRGASGVDGYFNAFGEVTHNDMTYYASLVGKPMSETAAAAVKEKKYSLFVPVASIYQTGRSYMYDGQKRYATSVQPYVIPFGKDFDFDLNKYTTEGGMYVSGSVVLPNGISYKIKNVTKPAHGKVAKKSDGVYTYTPDNRFLRSGEIKVTLELADDSGRIQIDDVDLVLEFEQSHEINKTMLQRTVYDFAEGAMPSSARAAFESNYAGHAAKTETDNVNPTQNGNTEIWSYDLLSPTSVYEVYGKIYVDETAKYRIALRGRWDCALFIAVNGNKNYKLAAEIKTDATHAGFYAEPETYSDLTDLKSGDWVYFRAVLKGEVRNGRNGYIGLGWGKFVPPAGVIDEDGNIVGSAAETVSVGYASAYRGSYEFAKDEFTTDYKYVRTYTYNYTDNNVAQVKQTVTTAEYAPWENTEQYAVSNMVDGNLETYIHNSRYNVTDKPFTAEVQLDKTITANRITFYAPTNNANARNYLPKVMKLWVSSDGSKWEQAIDVTATTLNNMRVAVNFDKKYTFSRYKFEVTDTHSTAQYKYISIANIELSTALDLPNGSHVSPDDEKLTYRGKWSLDHGAYTFGHAYCGKSGASVELEFTGTHFALFSVTANAKADVYADGKKVGTADLRNTDSRGICYVSPELKAGKHKVSVRVTSGTVIIDSVATWQINKK